MKQGIILPTMMSPIVSRISLFCGYSYRHIRGSTSGWLALLLCQTTIKMCPKIMASNTHPSQL